MAVLILVVMAGLLIGAVIFGVLRNNKKGGKPGAGHDAGGSPRNSS